MHTWLINLISVLGTFLAIVCLTLVLYSTYGCITHNPQTSSMNKKEARTMLRKPFHHTTGNSLK